MIVGDYGGDGDIDDNGDYSIFWTWSALSWMLQVPFLI